MCVILGRLVAFAYEDDDLHGDIEKHDFSVGILGDVSFGQPEQFCQFFDIGGIDKRCEAGEEPVFFGAGVVQFGTVLVVDETLSHHLLAVADEAFFAFPTQCGNLFTPFFECFYLSGVCLPHEGNKKFEEVFPFFAQLYGFEGFQVVSRGRMCNGVGCLGVEAFALLRAGSDSVGSEGGTLMRWVRERMVSSIFSGLSLTKQE